MRQYQRKRLVFKHLFSDNVTSRTIRQLLPGTSVLDLSPTWAAQHGYRDILRVQRDKAGILGSSITANAAVANGHLQIVRDLRENGVHCTSRGANIAASEGFLEIIRDLRANRVHCTEEGAKWAAVNGHLDILKDLVEHAGISCTTAMANEAAMDGRFEILDYLWKEHKISCDHTGANWAACEGRLDMLKYLEKEFGLCCTTEGANLAALRGHLEVIRYLKAQHDIDVRVPGVRAAACMGHIHVLKYFIEELGMNIADKINYPEYNPANNAAENGDAKTLRFLHGIGIRASNSILGDAARSGCYDVVEFLLCEGYTILTSVMNDLLSKRLLDVRIIFLLRAGGC